MGDKMEDYNYIKLKELEIWKNKMRKKPSLLNKASKGVQNKFNSILPDNYHNIVTSAIKNMTKIVLFGSKYTTKKPLVGLTLKERDNLALDKIKTYKNAAIIKGAGTGAGGILIGLTDLPLLLSIKIKLLYDLASIYGFNVKDYRERIYILSIFQLAFSSQDYVNKVFNKIENWDKYKYTLCEDINDLDWRSFQQEYRDYIDLAKLLQLLTGIGAFVGAYVNNKLVDKLGEYAMYAYRMRILSDEICVTKKTSWFNKIFKK